MDTITIRIRDVNRDSDTYSLILESPYLNRIEKIDRIENYSALARLAALRDSLEIDTARGSLNCKLSPQRAAKLLGGFRDLGSVAFITLLGGQAYKGRQNSVQRYFKDAIAKAPVGERRILTLSSSLDLPLDLMTITDNGKSFDPGPGSFDDQARRLTEQASECFVGFRFTVRKTGLHMEATERSLVNVEGTSKVYPYWHQNVRDVDKELARLKDFPYFDVANPMPDVNFARQQEAGRELARRLVEHVDEAVDIVHFTCHCDSGKNIPPLEHKLILAARDGIHRLYKVGVAVRNIQGIARYMDEHDAPIGPLAFLSACAAADISYESPTSIPDALLGSGYRAVVAPIVSIHFQAALEMAMLFYGALGENANTVGSALVDARRELLRRYCNPLGLLYSCYGDSRLGQSDNGDLQ